MQVRMMNQTTLESRPSMYEYNLMNDHPDNKNIEISITTNLNSEDKLPDFILMLVKIMSKCRIQTKANHHVSKCHIQQKQVPS